MNAILKEIQPRLNFLGVLPVASRPNDLLPSRFEDKVGGQLAKEFGAYLEKMISDGTYTPSSASFVPVPKPGFTTRPAALLTLSDRIVFEALIDSIKPSVEKKLLSSAHVMWPRAAYVDKRWGEFEKAPLLTEEDYIVNVDVTAFYDSIDHSILEDKIVKLTGENKVANALKLFLDKIMGSNKGLPQGILGSDTLATLYLQSVDAAMLRTGFSYWRHGDDIRMSVESMSLARESIATVEAELRKIGLVLNSSKCLIQKADHYDKHLKETNKVYETIKRKIYEEKVKYLSEDDEALIATMDEAELDEQFKWDLFYHHSITIKEVIQQISEHLQPDELDIARDLFRSTLEGLPDGDSPLPKDQFHVQLTRSIFRLAAGKSEEAIDSAAMLIAKFPEKTELISTYLMSLVSLCSKKVALQVEDIINSDLFLTVWQKAWIYRVMLDCAEELQDETIQKISDSCFNPKSHWLEKAEGFKLLSKLSVLKFEVLRDHWELVPEAYKPDLICSIVFLSRDCDKSKRFLEGINQDPIERVVASHCINKFLI